ncbi:MAG: hypothetical protein M3010_07985 [Candidatus Dormibacteraeota bacterium]|nr:hypothetical protein [Candidatus Dormibacteraeota bacterium]
MRITVRFVDGERLEGNADQVSLDSGGFTLVGTGGNTRSIWVGAGAIKYVAIHPATSETYERDPRDADRLAKIVLHFLDGETLRTYEDEAYLQQPGGFTMRLWDEQTKQLVKAIVPGSSLKGVFTVEVWDSRSEEEKRKYAGEPAEEPASIPESAAIPEPGLMATPSTDQAIAESHASSGSGPGRGGSLGEPTGSAEERHLQLRARVSQLLGSTPAGDPGPGEDEPGSP